MKNPIVRLLCIGVVVVSGLPGLLRAELQETASSEQTRDGSVFSSTLPIAELERYRGGSEVYLGIDSDGAVQGNVAYDLTTGHNYIGEGSFSNANGFPIVIQNTGNNVLIQNATNINLQLQ